METMKGVILPGNSTVEFRQFPYLSRDMDRFDKNESIINLR